MDALLKDLRYAARVLWNNPGFSAVAIVALALGIGANTAIFSVVNAVLLRPLPVVQPERIVAVHDQFTAIGLPSIGVSAPDYADITRRTDIFEKTAVTSGANFNLTASDQPERLAGSMVTASFFPLFGVKPIAGRWFLPEEDRPGANRVIVISQGMWARLFASDPHLPGRTVSLNGMNYTVAGIMPESFRFPARRVEIWTPIAFTPRQLDPVDERGHQWLQMFARLRPGVSVDQAQAAMRVEAKRFAAQYPNNFPKDSGWGIQVAPLLSEIVGNTRKAVLTLLGAVAFVLLIACANVANLMLARASARYREIAIRTAIGASRLMIARQLLTECVLLALIGGGLGVLLAVWGIDLLRLVGPKNLPRLDEVSVDGWVLAFTFVISTAAGLLFGLAPALQSSRTDLHESLKEGGRSGTVNVYRQRLRAGLVISEVALVLVLLVAAGLMIRSFARLGQVQPGFDPNNLLTMHLSLPASKYAKEARMAAFYEDAVKHIRRLPGVEAASAIANLPLSGGLSSASFLIKARPVNAGESAPHADVQSATADYFRAMRIPLLRGRGFRDQDGADAPKVVIIDDVLAKTYWPGRDPLGTQVTFGDPQKGPWYTVVGIVGNVKHRELDTAPKGVLYGPNAQFPSSDMTIVVRARKDPNALAGPVRAEIQSMDRDQPVYDIKTMDQWLGESLARRRFTVLLLSIFAGVALALAIVGIYGVMSYSVSQRTHEIGIRMALGAHRRDVLRNVVGQGLRMAGAGVGIGVAGALVITQLLKSQLYGVGAADPLTFALVAILLPFVAMAASYIPARRATRVDPMMALRYE